LTPKCLGLSKYLKTGLVYNACQNLQFGWFLNRHFCASNGGKWDHSV